MKNFDKILIFENYRRIKMLSKFRKNVLEYLDNIQGNWKVNGPIENEKAKELRQTINENLEEASSVVTAASISYSITYTPPPAIGGYIQQVDIFTNFFNLHTFSITHSSILDFIDRAMGVYRKNTFRSIVRIFNPFYWMDLIIRLIINIPFSIVERAGVSKSSLENSAVVRLIKFILYIIIVLSSLLEALYLLGLLQTFKAALGLDL